ncbi:hypothetical protein IMAU70092_01722 [Lactiplantibacillus plantarum]|nr:hypothetical protein Nizo2889_0661 [Lactiplantibacillus plantarum]MCG0714376.1 hypothetical protein [Lactiplantibacillus plantarum]
MLFHKFFDFFEGYEDCYVIIGGNAAAIWLAQDHQDFRATQDYDMVVIFEIVNWAFHKSLMTLSRNMATCVLR